MLEIEDLKQFAAILSEDLGRALGGYDLRISILDSLNLRTDWPEAARQALNRGRIMAEPESGLLYIPVMHQSRRLGLVTATPRLGGALSEEALALLPTVLRLSLEKMLLYKISITDEETRLRNPDFFRTYLKTRIKELTGPDSGQARTLRLGAAGQAEGLCVILAEIRDFERLTAEYGRLETLAVLQAAAEGLSKAAGSVGCLARLSQARLGLILPASCAEAAEDVVGKFLEAFRRASGGQAFKKARPALGLASYPADMTDGRGEDGEARSEARAALLLEKAELALHRALEDKNEDCIAFRDILKRGGRVVQTLPYNRVVVNLGRQTGAREGQVFVVGEPGIEDEPGIKAEITLFDVGDDFALGELTHLTHSLGRVRPGDALVLSRTSLEDAAAGERPDEASLDPLLGLPAHGAFLARLAERIEEPDRFAIMLVQVDGYDHYRATMGHLECDAQFRSLYDLLQPGLPPGCLIGRFSSDSLALYCPGLDEEAARALAASWRDDIAGRLRRTCSFGLAVYPCGSFKRPEMLTGAQKALDHASFYGPSSLAVFNSESLNISGDKLFETGDLDGAVEEYQKGLTLNPEDLNLINSLGVCYGFQNNTELALETFDRVLGLDPDNLMGLYNKGFTLAMADRREEALECLSRASAIDPESFDVLFNQGRVALEMDRIEEARTCFQRAAALPDRRPIVFRYLGQTLLKDGRTEEAVDAYKAAARYDPDDAASLSQLGVLYLQRGTDPEVALSLVKQAVDLDGSNSLFRQRLARAFQVGGDLEAAAGEYGQALEMGAKSREVCFEYGGVLLNLGRRDEARAMFREALELDPAFQPARAALDSLGGEE